MQKSYKKREGKKDMSKELEALNYLVNLAVVGNKETNQKVFEKQRNYFPSPKP